MSKNSHAPLTGSTFERIEPYEWAQVSFEKLPGRSIQRACRGHRPGRRRHPPTNTAFKNP
jgi:hypothetical protein